MYSHSWEIERSVTPDDPRWKNIIADAARIISSSELELTGDCDSTVPPVITSNEIIINGGPPDRWDTDQSGDCLNLPLWTVPDEFSSRSPNDRAYGYCKTSRNPYDQVVCAILISVKRHLRDDILIHSNGELNTDWLKGPADRTGSPIRMYTHVFPDRHIPDPLIENQTLLAENTPRPGEEPHNKPLFQGKLI